MSPLFSVCTNCIYWSQSDVHRVEYVDSSRVCQFVLKRICYHYFCAVSVLVIRDSQLLSSANLKWMGLSYLIYRCGPPVISWYWIILETQFITHRWKFDVHLNCRICVFWNSLPTLSRIFDISKSHSVVITPCSIHSTFDT